MEYRQMRRKSTFLMILLFLVLIAFGGLAFAAGVEWSLSKANADDAHAQPKGGVDVIYPKKTELDFNGMAVEGQVQSPGEFYFEHHNEEKFDSLVQRRKNFHREMLRDAVLSK